MRVYIAGPMSNYEDFNEPAFARATADLRGAERMAWLSARVADERGVSINETGGGGSCRVNEIVSPAELDTQDGVDYADVKVDGEWVTKEADYTAFLARDVQIVAAADCIAVVVLPGWEDSRGAALEVHVARALGKPVLAYPGLEAVKAPTNVKPPSDEGILEEAQRLVHGNRGADYGPPIEDFRRTAAFWTTLTNFEYEFQPEQVPLFMIGVKLSRLVETPTKRDSAVDIGGYDECFAMTMEALGRPLR